MTINVKWNLVLSLIPNWRSSIPPFSNLTSYLIKIIRVQTIDFILSLRSVYYNDGRFPEPIHLWKQNIHHIRFFVLVEWNVKKKKNEELSSDCSTAGAWRACFGRLPWETSKTSMSSLLLRKSALGFLTWNQTPASSTGKCKICSSSIFETSLLTIKLR